MATPNEAPAAGKDTLFGRCAESGDPRMLPRVHDRGGTLGYSLAAPRARGEGAMTLPSKQEDARYEHVRQYSLAQVLAVWAAAAIPMAVLAWVVAPLLGGLLAVEAAFIKALLLCLTVGLVWQFVLTMILVRREQGSLRFSRVRAALWLLPPLDPGSGRVGGAGSGCG